MSGTGGTCSLARDGVAVARNTFRLPIVAHWLQLADAAYSQITDGAPNRPGTSPPTIKSYRPTASSMLLESIVGINDVLEFLEPLHPTLRRSLGDAVVCNADQAWLRRQFSPHLAPPQHHPHGWHQDGALGFDFSTHPEGSGPEAVLPMLTAWVPLTACGRDAPGLEFVVARPSRTIGLRELADDSLRAAFPAAVFCTPELQAGDAVLMSGDVLHRTHVTARMQRVRTSVEFRFHSANDIPPRLAGQRFVRCW